MARLCPVNFLAFCRRSEDELNAAEQLSVDWMEKPVIAVLMKPCGQDMLQEAAHEFHDRQGHGALAVPPFFLALGCFPVPKGRLAVLDF